VTRLLGCIAVVVLSSSAMTTVRADEVPPPDARSVARRALVLGALVERSVVEAAMPQLPAKERAAALAAGSTRSAETAKWLTREHLDAAVSAEERRLLKKPFGTWSAQERIDASWRSEALVSLAWALRIVDRLPAWDTQVAAGDLVVSLPLMHVTDAFVSKATLRPVAEIRGARDLAELWHWRARTTQLIKSKQPVTLPPGYTLEKVVAQSAAAAEAKGAFKAVDHDFPAHGKAYSRLSDSEWSELMSVARERQYGLNWLCGYAGDWDQVPTDT
jgi:hypothetical protein